MQLTWTDNVLIVNTCNGVIANYYLSITDLNQAQEFIDALYDKLETIQQLQNLRVKKFDSQNKSQPDPAE